MRAVRAACDTHTAHLATGALVALHDSTSGVRGLVDELIPQGFEIADSLIVSRR